MSQLSIFNLNIRRLPQNNDCLCFVHFEDDGCRCLVDEQADHPCMVMGQCGLKSIDYKRLLWLRDNFFHCCMTSACNSIVSFLASVSTNCVPVRASLSLRRVILIAIPADGMFVMMFMISRGALWVWLLAVVAWWWSIVITGAYIAQCVVVGIPRFWR